MRLYCNSWLFCSELYEESFRVTQRLRSGWRHVSCCLAAYTDPWTVILILGVVCRCYAADTWLYVPFEIVMLMSEGLYLWNSSGMLVPEDLYRWISWYIDAQRFKHWISVSMQDTIWCWSRRSVSILGVQCWLDQDKSSFSSLVTYSSNCSRVQLKAREVVTHRH